MLQWRGPFDPEAFSLCCETPTARETSLGSKDNTQACFAAREYRNGSLIPCSTARESLVERGAGQTADGSKTDRSDDKVPLELNDRERELILNHSLAHEELTGRLRILPRPGEPPVYRFTLDDLDELAGYVAAEANHTQDKKQRKEWDQLFSRMAAVLESYTGEDDAGR
jgi:hypothetical protein